MQRFIGATPAYAWQGGLAGQSFIGATPAYAWQGGIAGFGTAFGLDVPTPLPGNPGRVANVKPTGYNYCGDAFGFQTMLRDLGFYTGAVDGQAGSATIKAGLAAAASFGVPFQSGTTISNDFCQALMDAWDAKFGIQPSIPSALPDTPAAPPATTIQPTPPHDSEQPVVQKAGDWWAQRSTVEKVAVVGGGAIVLFAIGNALT